MQLIPSMDLMGGRIVRLREGDRGRATWYEHDPLTWIERLVQAGAPRIHLVDLDAAFGGARQQAFATLPQRFPSVCFQLGGGLRSRAAIEEVIAAGFDPVVGTLAVEQPAELEGLPGSRVVLALDLKDGRVVTRGWTEASARENAEIFASLLVLGFHRALVTDVSRDGGLEGPGLEALRTVAAAGFAVQASGGLRNLDDLDLVATVPGVVGAISGKAILESRIALADPRTRAALGAC
jgi:phosphoribosylformimino-5-aminoimidazole carboxamide ribotide isomerase